MTFKEIYQALTAQTTIPVTYYAYPEGQVPDLPFMVYYYPSNNDDPADNVNYGRIQRLNVELYTSEKDFSTEEDVEEVLIPLGVFTKTESYLNSENMYEVLYEMEVAIDGEN